jgi:hypothetical protein
MLEILGRRPGAPVCDCATVRALEIEVHLSSPRISP